MYVHQNIYKNVHGARVKQDTNITPSMAQRTLRKGDKKNVWARLWEEGPWNAVFGTWHRCWASWTHSSCAYQLHKINPSNMSAWMEKGHTRPTLAEESYWWLVVYNEQVLFSLVVELLKSNSGWVNNLPPMLVEETLINLSGLRKKGRHKSGSTKSGRHVLKGMRKR